MLIAFALLTLTACSPADDEVGGVDLATLTDLGGCGDVYLYAANAEGTALLSASIGGGVIEAAYAEGTDRVERSFTIPDDADLEVVLEVGTNLRERACNDIAVDHVIDERWLAVEGTATFEATLTGDEPKSWSMPADATLLLEEVLLEEESTGEQMLVGGFTMQAAVGWFPG